MQDDQPTPAPATGETTVYMDEEFVPGGNGDGFLFGAGNYTPWPPAEETNHSSDDPNSWTRTSHLSGDGVM